MNKLKIKLYRLNDWLCRHAINRCGYCNGELTWLPCGVSICASCKRRH